MKYVMDHEPLSNSFGQARKKSVDIGCMFPLG